MTTAFRMIVMLVALVGYAPASGDQIDDINASLQRTHASLQRINRSHDERDAWERAREMATGRYIKAACEQRGDGFDGMVAVAKRASMFPSFDAPSATMDDRDAAPYAVHVKGEPSGYNARPDLGPWVLHCARHDYRLTWERIR